MKQQERVKLLESIVHHIQQTNDTIHFYNVEAHSSPWAIHSGVQLTRLNCLLWLSIRLFLLPQVLPSIIHSSPLTHFLREQYGTG
jgi:hypothetical protein